MRSARALLLILGLGSVAFGAANLVPGGGFDSSAGDVPKGWERLVGSADELMYATDNPQSGTHLLKLDTGKTEKGLQLQWHYKDAIAIEPGAKYRLEYYFRIDKSNIKGGQAVYVRGSYLDAAKKELPWRKVGRVSLHTGGRARVTTGWRFRQTEFTVPSAAVFLDLSVSPARGFKGITAVDSVRIVKLPGGTLTLPQGGHAFDFTPVDVKPTPGFTGVPADLAYTKEKGFGWSVRGRRAIGNTHNGNGYPETLDSTGVRSATFLCDLPNGHYLASMYMGSLWRTLIDDMNHVIGMGRQNVVNDVRSHNQLMDEEYFRHAKATLVTPDDLARPGYAVWDKYIARRYRRHDFEFDVVNKQAALRIRRGYANGLVIFPAKLKAEYQKAINQIEEIRQREFVETWAEFMPFPVEETDFHPDATDRARGYVAFHRHWMRRVQYAARPQPDEVNPSLSLFATPGEYEPTTFSLWPLRDLKNVRINMEPLRSENGDTLPGTIFRVWYHQHRQERRARPCTAYKINTAYLPDWDTRNLYKDITTRCWLSAKLPKDAKPGLYTGAVRIVPEDAKAETIPIKLRVLGFHLIRKETMHTFRRAGGSVIVPYPSSYPFKPGDNRNKQFYRAEAIRDLYEHGFQPEYGAWWQAYWEKDGDKLTVEWDKDNALSGRPGEYLQIIKDLAPAPPKWLWVDACSIGHRYIMPAFSGKPNGGITAKHIDQWLDELEKKIAPLGFGRIYVGPWGEESHFPPGKGFETFLKFHRHVSENRDRWPHVYTVHTCNTDWGQPPTIREADLTCLGMFHGVAGSAEEQVEMAQQGGKPFGIYGVRGRWVGGFYFWKTGAFATYHEFYAPYWGTPNNDWDNALGMDQSARQVMNEAPGWCNATYSPDGRMIGTWFWEEMREGVDDHDYMNTLETLIKQTTNRKEAAVQAARKHAQNVLSQITDAVEIDLSPMMGLVYRPVAEEDHDGLRWKAALAAERLNAAMRATTSAIKPAHVQKKQPFLLGVRALPAREGAAQATMQMITPTVFHVRELDTPITVDGRLDETPYKEQPQARDSFDHQLKRPAKFRTTVHVLKHADTLYLGVTCFEPRIKGLRIKETEENGSVWNDDCVEVFLDPGHTHRSYYHFGVNAGGVGALFWHPYASHKLGVPKPVKKMWQVAVHRGRDRWTLEFALPFAQFDIKKPVFGLSVCRNNPQHGELSCWTILPKRTFHQPDAFADVYLPGAKSVLKRIWLGNLAAGENRARLWITERPGAGPVSIVLKAPDATVSNLKVQKQGAEQNATIYEAPYDLARTLGTYQFTVRAGDLPLGPYEGLYSAAFFTASLKKMFHWQGPGDPIESTVTLLTPPAASLKGLQLRARCLKDGRSLKQHVFSPLPGRAFKVRFGIADLDVGTYDLELTLLSPDGQTLKRIISEFEILPRFDV